MSVCEVCGESFGNSGALARHAKRHTSGRPTSAPTAAASAPPARLASAVETSAPFSWLGNGVGDVGYSGSAYDGAAAASGRWRGDDHGRANGDRDDDGVGWGGGYSVNDVYGGGGGNDEDDDDDEDEDDGEDEDEDEDDEDEGENKNDEDGDGDDDEQDGEEEDDANRDNGAGDILGLGGKRQRNDTPGQLQLQFVAMAQRYQLSLSQTNGVLRFIHQARAQNEDLSRLPVQGRTLFRRIDRWGATAVAGSRSPTADDARPVLPPSEFRERVFRHNGVELRVYMRDLWSVLNETFVDDPAVARQLHFGAVSEFAKDGSRLRSEIWTADWWAKVERALPPFADLLAYILNMDASAVTWNKSLTPVYVTAANLPHDARRLHALMPVVAYVEKIAAPQKKKKSAAFRKARNHLQHRFLAELVAPVEAARRAGGRRAIVNNVERCLVPVLCLVVADNEEKATLSLTYKKKSGAMPCHQCLVPAECLGDTVRTSTTPFPPRTVAMMRAVVEAAGNAKRGQRGPAVQRAKELSLHLIANGLWLPGFDLYQALTVDLLHDADLGVYKRFVLALFAWLERVAPDVADELDRRLFVMSAAPAPCIKRFGPDGFRGLLRAEGMHYRSLMTLLPLALLDLPSVDVTEAAALATEWVDIYAYLRGHEFVENELVRWQQRAAAWGVRLGAWLRAVGDGDGVFPKLHILLGGHVVDAIRLFGAPTGYNASAFEGRHVSAVKQPARHVSRAVDLVSQLAKRARREEYVDVLTRDLPAAPPARRRSEKSTALLSWTAGPNHTVTLAHIQRDLHVAKLSEATANFLRAELPAEFATAAAALQAMRQPFARMLRVSLVRGGYAYAHPSFRGRPRYDNVAVLGQGGATWYAQLIVGARFVLPSGKPFDAVLVRWFEKVADLRGVPSSIRRTWAGCPHVVPGNPGVDWCLPTQILSRVSLVPDWVPSNGGPAAPAGSMAYVNIHLVALTEDKGYKDQAVDEDEDDEDEAS